MLKLIPHTEEMVKPEQPTRPKHPIDVEKNEVQQIGRNPVTQNVHRMDDIQSVIEERQPLRNAYV